MNRRSRILISVLALVALAAVAIIGTSSSSAAKKKKPATVSVAKNKALGKILVDSKGRTLYELEADGKNKSTCSGQCATFWPPYAAPKKITVGSGVSKSSLKVITRSDGKKQLSYHGHPLYRYSGDTKKGQTNGEGVNAFGGFWYVMDGKGKPNTGAQQGAGSSTGSGSPDPYPGYSSASGGTW
jgi:predicted lipoprotein with Yx(FWY)xxD motif